MNIKELKKITKNLNTLYVEDNKHLNRVSMELYRDIFKQIDLAEDGVCGLEMYKQKNYDLVISDINLPRMNGVQMLKEILEIDRLQPIIVISAYSEIEYLTKLDGMKIEHFLTKPVSSKNMLLAIYQSVKKLEVV